MQLSNETSLTALRLNAERKARMARMGMMHAAKARAWGPRSATDVAIMKATADVDPAKRKNARRSARRAARRSSLPAAAIDPTELYKLQHENASLRQANVALHEKIKHYRRMCPVEPDGAIVPNIDTILNVVAQYYGTTKHDIKSNARHRGVMWPRQIAMYLSRKMTLRSYPRIGAVMGGRDHTTIMHSCDKMEMMVAGDGDLAQEIEDLKAEIQEVANASYQSTEDSDLPHGKTYAEHAGSSS